MRDQKENPSLAEGDISRVPKLVAKPCMNFATKYYASNFKARWEQFRKFVIQSRGQKCERCGERFEVKDLHLHHIFKRSIFREFIFEVFNVVICCQLCHNKLENFEPITCKLF
jgi:hypothetical protein